ncbi:replication initiator [Actinomadura sp. SCN-SB]|uniref:replication initiator n=1 Tax=Actinomadura sp. SCN-SB TaxID=3373092 RepID=UPI00374FF6BE
MITAALREQARLSYARVIGYQRRGLIHFHAVIRLDGPDGPDQPPPEWATAELLTRTLHTAAQTEVPVPHPDRTIRSQRGPAHSPAPLGMVRALSTAPPRPGPRVRPCAEGPGSGVLDRLTQLTGSERLHQPRPARHGNQCPP